MSYGSSEMSFRPQKTERISVRITLYFLLADSLLWLAYAVVVAAGLHPALPDSAVLRWLIPILALAGSAALPGFYLLARRFGAAGYYPLLTLLLLISLPTILDDFGLADLNVLILHLIPFVLLVIDRSYYRSTTRGSGA